MLKYEFISQIIDIILAIIFIIVSIPIWQDFNEMIDANPVIVENNNSVDYAWKA